MTVARHWLIQGKVQGVCFRAYTVEIARKLNCVGWVRNLTTGEVEVLAQGTSDDLQKLDEWLSQGSPDAKVTHITSHAVPVQNLVQFVKKPTVSHPELL